MTKANVLVVDDEEPIRRNFRAFLEDMGYSVSDAGNSEQAMSIFSRSRFDIVLTDLRMVGMDGMGLIEHLSKNAPDTPVVVVSGSGDTRDAISAIRKGAWDYILKPVAHAEELDIVIQRSLEKARLLRESRQHRDNLEKLVKQRTRELQQSEVRYRMLFESAQDAILMLQGTRFVDCNPAALAMFGCTKEELVGKTPMDFSPARRGSGQDLGEKASEMVQSAQAGHPALFEWKHRRLDGTEFEAEVSLNSLQLGEQTLLQAIVRDITDRKRAEEDLRRSEATIRSVFRAAPVGICIIKDRKFRSINEYWHDQFGYSKEDLIGEQTRVVFESDAEWERTRQALLVHAQDHESPPVEAKLRRHDGTFRDVILTAAPLDPVDTAAGFVVVAHDITERKRAEAEQRTLQDQLAQAQKMESIGRLAGGVAHDFNNMLTSILGFAGIAADELDESEPVQAHLQQVRAAAERAAGLTQQLLAFSRKQVIEPVPLDLGAVARDIQKMLSRLLGEDISIELELAEPAGIVKADRGQIEQVLINLAINARDAMPQGGCIRIGTENLFLDQDRLRLHPGAAAGQYVILTVSDTGHGMTAEVKRHLFEPFFTTKPAGKGTGLGMAIVYGAVSQNGGLIEVESEVGQGTTFRIFLPQVIAAALPSRPTAAIGTLPRGNETVLLVEDDQDLRKLNEMVLQRLGYRLLVCDTGTKALQVSDEYPAEIHLLMTDIVLPGIDGLALAAALTKKRPSLKVLLVSGYPGDTNWKEGALGQGIPFLAKPYSAATLAAKIRDAIQGPDRQVRSLETSERDSS